MIARAVAEAVFAEAVAACDPAALVRDAMKTIDPDRARIGIAIGKAALAMARGAGPVARGIVVAPKPGEVPLGWRVVVASHPEPDERSLAAGQAVVELIESSHKAEVVVALISGGASALVEQSLVPLDELRATLRAVMAAGVAIADLNLVRGALSKLKAGQLAVHSAAPIVTFAVSDVASDDLRVIGSGPTIGPWLAAPGEAVDLGVARDVQRRNARAILARCGIAIPAQLDVAVASELVTRSDRAVVLAPMSAFASAALASLRRRGIRAELVSAPLEGDVTAVADQLAAHDGAIVAFGEPTLRLPEAPGEGGRAQQLALELARRLRGGDRSAFVVGSDGIDGPAPRARPAPAGAFVDGATWDAIGGHGFDPAAALTRCDAGPALAAIHALVVTGPTGINHADLVLIG